MISVFSRHPALIAPGQVVATAGDEAAVAMAERSRQLRIGLSKGVGYAQSDARDLLEHVVIGDALRRFSRVGR